MKSILNKAKLRFQGGSRPPAAVEISPEGVLAAALPAPVQPRRGAQVPHGAQAPVYAFQALAAGAIVPGMGEPNLRAPEAVAAAIHSVLEQVSPRTRDVTMVLPDSLVRVFVLDFDSLPQGAAEVYPVLRFRLRKIVPFDVEHAALTYQVLKQNKDECKVLVAVMPRQVLAEYEGAVRAAGYEPGAVLSSSLAALATIDSTEAVLSAHLSPTALTTSISIGQDVLLYRTLDLPEEPVRRLDEVQRGIAVAAAYFEDKLMSRPLRLRYSGIGGAEAFARWINNPELSVVEMAPHPASLLAAAFDLANKNVAAGISKSGGTSIAGVAGALAGVT